MLATLPAYKITAMDYMNLSDAISLNVELIDGGLHQMPFDLERVIPLVCRVSNKLSENGARTSYRHLIFCNEYNVFIADLVVFEKTQKSYHPDLIIELDARSPQIFYSNRLVDKVASYAQLGVPLLWLINLSKRIVVEYSKPVDGSYRLVKDREETINFRGEVYQVKDFFSDE